MTLSIVDVDLAADTGIWTQALAGRTSDAKKLMRAFRREVEKLVTSVVVRALLKTSITTLNGVLGGLYRDEVEELADLVDAEPREVLLANLVYDLVNSVGCSTFVQPSPAGPLHARNLDWVFSGDFLQKHLMVLRVANAPCGDYATVTWPGMFGVLTGMAPGRFSVTVNYVRHVEESGPLGVAKRAVQGYWPVTWLVRKVFDEAKSFDAAVRQLRSAPLLAPVLFTVAGTQPDEGVVIERTTTTATTRRVRGDARVCVTNHYVCDALADESMDVDDGDSNDRFDALKAGLAKTPVTDAAGALRLLGRKSLIRSDTQHQVVMRAADGLLVVKVPGERAVTVTMT